MNKNADGNSEPGHQVKADTSQTNGHEVVAYRRRHLDGTSVGQAFDAAGLVDGFIANRRLNIEEKPRCERQPIASSDREKQRVTGQRLVPADTGRHEKFVWST